MDELGESLVARLAHVAREARVRVVRVDLEGDEAERVERRRLDDGHVVGRPYCRTRDVGAGAPADVRHAPFDARADALDHSGLVESAQEVERVAAADRKRLCALDRRERVRRLVD